MSFSRRRSTGSSRLRKRRPQKLAPSAFEPLEPRQLLSCTIDIRLAGGGKTATVSNVGQVVNLEVWAVISGKTSPGTGDGFQEAVGSILGTRTAVGAVLGNLKASMLSPFIDTASQNGTQQDLNGDGALDVGGKNVGIIDGYFFPRDGGMDFNGVVSGATQSFELATLTYTVTSLALGQATNINFAPRVNPAYPEGVWREDNQPSSPNASVLSGSPVVIFDPAIPQTSPTGAISGMVFHDINGNGKQDPGDNPLAGVTVYIDADNDGSLDHGEISTTTDSAGKYSFGNLSSGNYVIRQKSPAGLYQSLPTVGTGNTIKLTTNQKFTASNFADAPAATVTGIVYKDVNGNGKQDSGEAAGVAGVTIYGDANNNNKLDPGEASTITASNGTYTLTGLPAGANIARQMLPAGYNQSFPVSGLGNHITLSAGQTLTKVNFGAHPTATPVLASITGTVFNDANGNRIDNSEAGLSGWSVYLDLNNDGSFEKATEPTMLTDSKGNFTFTGLAAGTYIVRVIRPAGWNQTTPINNLGQHITVASGAKATGVLFGEKKS